MKVPRDGSENRTETRKGTQRMNSCGEGKTTDDNREYSGGKMEEGDLSGCSIEPSTTALIPPWLRNSLGLSEKGDKKPNQKCLKVYCATTNEESQCAETGETKADAENDCLKCHFYIQDTPSTNPILEVNIGSEADFLQDAGAAEKLPSPWRSKSNRHNEVFGITKDRSVKSEVTSIDVVVPVEEQDEEKRKFKQHRAKSRMRRRISNGYYKSEDNQKGEGDAISRSSAFLDDFLMGEPFPVSKYLDERLLLLCGKKTIDSLTQEDLALLQEMKNQIGHKEGFEKLFNEIRESAFTDKGATKEGRKSDRKEEYRKDYFHCKSEENRSGGGLDEERKLSDDSRKHHEKKFRSQQRQMKYIDEQEAEKDKKGDKWKCAGQKQRDIHADKEKKLKLRHCDYAVIEKVVTETLQKFIDVYRVQVPPDVVCSMKKNIIQTLQNEYQEANGGRRGLDAVLAVQDQLKSAGILKCSMQFHACMEERDDKQGLFKIERKRHQGTTNFTPEENVVTKDVPEEGEEMIICKVREENGTEETLNVLRKDFERSLDLIQHQLDVTGSRLCSVVLEKSETEDKKLRIVHNFANGVTESIKIYDRTGKGSPEGDNVNTAICDCQQNFQKTKVKQSQWSQTGEATYGKVSTQTDWVDVSVKHLMNAELNPGLYRITKATESGRFYLTPEVLDDDDGVEEDNKVKRVSSEMCMRPEVEKNKGDVVKYASRETFVSEGGITFGSARTLWKAFRSDCLGLNVGIMNKPNLEKAPVDPKPEEDLVEEEIENEERTVEESKNAEGGSSEPDGYHRECVWLWNGKKMTPGVDLKVHVEDLLREKLNEMLSEGRIAEGKNVAAEVNDQTVEMEESAKNLEIRKTRATFCMTNEEATSPVCAPFIFSGSDAGKFAVEGLTIKPEMPILGKSVREIGTQNSQHTIVSLNISKMKPRSKLCTVAKFSKRKQSSGRRGQDNMTLAKQQMGHPFAESVGEAKKVKLEFREANEVASSREKCSNTDSVRECFSIISNGSSSSIDGPVRVKLIGIGVSKEKTPGHGDSSSAKSSETKDSIAEEAGAGKDEQKKYKHWEIIENVLNRVSQKEKDILWNDIRDFVKKKIGRDINDEGAREVCIEIEQDVPKFAKGKASHLVVARGNYTRTEGDVEVEVDLTLDDLERILRHRQKKMRRRTHGQSQKTESKASTTSSDTLTDYHTFKCRPFVHHEDYLTNNEVKMLKDYN